MSGMTDISKKEQSRMMLSRETLGGLHITGKREELAFPRPGPMGTF